MKAKPLFRFLFLALAILASLLIFTWPLYISASAQSEAQFAQVVFLVLMPTILILTVNEYSSGKVDSRQLAMLGVLTALNALIRMLGAGVAGVETSFFLIIISAYVFGPGFGFLMGALSLLVSGLITGGYRPLASLSNDGGGTHRCWSWPIAKDQASLAAGDSIDLLRCNSEFYLRRTDDDVELAVSCWSW